MTMGVTLSHPVLCHLINNSTYDLMLTRSHENEDTKGLGEHKLKDTEYAYLEMSLIIQKSW